MSHSPGASPDSPAAMRSGRPHLSGFDAGTRSIVYRHICTGGVLAIRGRVSGGGPCEAIDAQSALHARPRLAKPLPELPLAELGLSDMQRDDRLVALRRCGPTGSRGGGTPTDERGDALLMLRPATTPAAPTGPLNYPRGRSTPRRTRPPPRTHEAINAAHDGAELGGGERGVARHRRRGLPQCGGRIRPGTGTGVRDVAHAVKNADRTRTLPEDFVCWGHALNARAPFVGGSARAPAARHLHFAHKRRHGSCFSPAPPYASSGIPRVSHAMAGKREVSFELAGQRCPQIEEKTPRGAIPARTAGAHALDDPPNLRMPRRALNNPRGHGNPSNRDGPHDGSHRVG